ncbi:uncharacterized protein LOC126817404 [Patella vulgata]|uniref:uncharacterized protein LOC126817404 n=1 Tax=Patella vulgata TaxID=6465 RepID=UPI00217FDCFB|nr:uncharacterized protein LOC126817404 [Patella vulgata]
MRSSSRAAENPYATPTRAHYGCCETEVRYASPNITTINNRNYTVVHLKGMFQYIPTGRCKSGLTCSHGECVQKFRAHWVLVYNSSATLTGPPVSFVPIKVHSHCECLNVGRGQ